MRLVETLVRSTSLHVLFAWAKRPTLREVAAAAMSSMISEGCSRRGQAMAGVSPCVDPLFVLKMYPLLECLVDLRKPTCRRCIQLCEEQLVRQSGEHWGGPTKALLQPADRAGSTRCVSLSSGNGKRHGSSYSANMKCRSGWK